MNHIFLDTNILLDFLGDRKPYSEPAADLFSLADKGKVKLYVSAISFNNIYYIITQNASAKKAISLIDELEMLVSTLEVNKKIIREAVDSQFNDFEDAIQYFCAKSASRIEFIVTRNHKDFKLSDLPVFSAETALSLISA